MKTRLSRTYFKKLTAGVGGMLSPDVYREYYIIAKERSSGSIIELGTGQGASTIAFALGVRDSGRNAKVYAIDEFFQYGVDGPHPAGVKEYGDKAIDINLNSFRENMRKSGVEDYVEVIAGKTDEITFDSSRSGRYDVLAIDVDGYIDRDLSIFYDRIVDGGILIIDDYRDQVNRHGVHALEKYGRMDKQEVKKSMDRLSPYKRGRLLGKHILTYRLVELFSERGLFEKDREIGSTLFCRKVGERPYSEYVDPKDIEAIERSIIDDFYELLSGKVSCGVRRLSLRKRIRRWLSRKASYLSTYLRGR